MKSAKIELANSNKHGSCEKKKKKQAMRLDLRGDKYWLGCTLLTKTMCPCPLLLQQSL
jgi:hypothetical protein